jgi:hypothetical protein
MSDSRSPFIRSPGAPSVARMSDEKNTPDTSVPKPDEVDLESKTEQDGTPVENPSG